MIVLGCGQNLATNTLKHLMDQLEERILQTDQLKNTSKRLQYRINRTLNLHKKLKENADKNQKHNTHPTNNARKIVTKLYKCKHGEIHREFFCRLKTAIQDSLEMEKPTILETKVRYAMKITKNKKLMARMK